jgi:hypothetical protein
MACLYTSTSLLCFKTALGLTSHHGIAQFNVGFAVGVAGTVIAVEPVDVVANGLRLRSDR